MKVFIANMSEDVWPFISSLSDAKARSFEIAENANMSDWNVFAFAPGEQGVLVTPRPLGREFLGYVASLTGAHHIEVLSPRRHSGQTSLDVLRDRKVFRRLVVLGRKKLVHLTAYCPSPQLYELITALRKRGAKVVLSDLPQPNDRWTTDFFGSKTGVRQVASSMSPGYICTNTRDAARVSAHIYKRTKGVVLKTNKGHSGFGVLIFRPGELPSAYDRCVETITTHLAKESYWSLFPIVVEEYVKENPQIAGGFPSIECRVDERGRVEYLYHCGMRMSHEGVYRGLEIHKSIVSSSLDRQIRKIGKTLGKVYASFGYRGYFDVDLLLTSRGKLYVTESNVRRTGGTYVYLLAVRLFGRNFADKTFTISRNTYPLPGKHMTFTKLHNILSSILYSHKTKEGVVITSEHMMLQDAMGFVIFGRTRARAHAIEREMEKLLQ
jgi:hypothetical protein